MQGKRVLVIEDNALNMKLVRSLLQLDAYEVKEAADAESGIELLRDDGADLVLMDIQLPGMDGLEATRRIKSHASLKDVPVVALTSYAMQGDEEKAKEAGCVGYIPKPIDTRTFLSTIAQFIA
jgi:CheY-like chemotaxis protein